MKISPEEEARRKRIRDKQKGETREKVDDLVKPSMLPDSPQESFPPGYLEDRNKEEKAKKPKTMRNGGYVRAADGCAVRGKTRGTMV